MTIKHIYSYFLISIILNGGSIIFLNFRVKKNCIMVFFLIEVQPTEP